MLSVVRELVFYVPPIPNPRCEQLAEPLHLIAIRERQVDPRGLGELLNSTETEAEFFAILGIPKLPAGLYLARVEGCATESEDDQEWQHLWDVRLHIAQLDGSTLALMHAQHGMTSSDMQAKYWRFV